MLLEIVILCPNKVASNCCEAFEWKCTFSNVWNGGKFQLEMLEIAENVENVWNVATFELSSGHF